MEWYVYFYCHPDTPDIPFYIGKGCGDRIDFHELAARNNWADVNPRKRQAIVDIHRSGREVVKYKKAVFTNELDAFIYEYAMIVAYHGNLTNETHLKGYSVRVNTSQTEEPATVDYVDVNGAARYLEVHPNTVRNAIESGKISATKVLGRWRVKVSELDRILRGDEAIAS